MKPTWARSLEIHRYLQIAVWQSWKALKLSLKSIRNEKAALLSWTLRQFWALKQMFLGFILTKSEMQTVLKLHWRRVDSKYAEDRGSFSTEFRGFLNCSCVLPSVHLSQPLLLFLWLCCSIFMMKRQSCCCCIWLYNSVKRCCKTKIHENYEDVWVVPAIISLVFSLFLHV